MLREHSTYKGITIKLSTYQGSNPNLKKAKGDHSPLRSPLRILVHDGSHVWGSSGEDVGADEAQWRWKGARQNHSRQC
jgi:hypothetical protein